MDHPMPSAEDTPDAVRDPLPGASAERIPRANVMLSATVERFGGGQPSRHRIRDLSAGGVRIDQPGDLKVGATVIVTVGALDSVAATVKWLEQGQAGLAFATRVDPKRALAKAAITPKVAGKQGQKLAVDRGKLVPTAGWTDALRNPYARRG